ncbi:arsenate reductase (glutaredoxin) [Acinetobacter sp. TSRC1-2]|uniref:arsenate reductase (glutaredoxin) n=1 Tax=unclassified Acinetobacter TaxID=196816 RepID=UPI003CEBFBB5
MSQKIKIYHNPACGTSRNTLELIRNTGQEPEVIEYLKTPPSKEELMTLIEKSGLSVRDAIRKNVEPYERFKLDQTHWTDDQLMSLMLEHPILINRPFVVTELGIKLCRPSELVLDLLSAPQLKAFSKEDGEVIIDQEGKRMK